MEQTFRDRLKLLMNDEKPYTWAGKVGIDRGLFQYYWQKGRIPTYKNLVKIQNYSGCSLDWLLTGKIVSIDQIANLPMMKEKRVSGSVVSLKVGKAHKNIRRIFASANQEDINLLEQILEKLFPEEVENKTLAKE